MGDVIQLPHRAGPKSNTAGVLNDLIAQDASGEMEGSIHIAATKHGTEFHVLGTCADRLQIGVLAMVRGLSFLTDKIVATGTVGHASSDAVNISWGVPKRRLPKRLRQATGWGELE